MGINSIIESFFPPNTKGLGVYGAGPDQNGVFEWEGPVGSGSDMLFGLAGWMMKNGWLIKKVDEDIDVSPVDKQYHDLIIGQRNELEARIKQGLGQAAVAVGDFDLLLHDQRKIKEFLNYFKEVRKAESELRKAIEKKDNAKIDEWKNKLKNAEIQTKAIFIDQVDAHNGQAAMVQAIQRWPTIIVDFQSITSFDMKEDGDLSQVGTESYAKKIADKLGISTAEGLILAVKQKLYEEWKNLFLSSLTERYERITQLVEGRRKSVDQYREWLKPHIARHKMINDALQDVDNAAGLSQSAFNTAGTASASQTIKLWCWKRVYNTDYHKMSRIRTEKTFMENPYDKSVEAALFGGFCEAYGNGRWYKGYETEFNKDGKRIIKMKDGKPVNAVPKDKEKDAKNNESLLTKYKGITPQQIEDWINGKDGIMTKSLERSEGPEKAESKWGPLDPDILYYDFMEITLERFIMRAPNSSVEDATFTIKNFLMSQNFLLIKLVEMKAEEWKFHRYVNEILGSSVERDGKMINIKDLIENEYPELFKKDKKKEDDNEKPTFKQTYIDPLTQPFKDISSTTKGTFKDAFTSLTSSSIKFLSKFGIEVEEGKTWFRGGWLKNGPYEATFKDRYTTSYIKAAGGEWGAVSSQLRSMMGM